YAVSTIGVLSPWKIFCSIHFATRVRPFPPGKIRIGLKSRRRLIWMPPLWLNHRTELGAGERPGRGWRWKGTCPRLEVASVAPREGALLRARKCRNCDPGNQHPTFA